MSKVFYKIILTLFPIFIILILLSLSLVSLKVFAGGGLQVLLLLMPKMGQEEKNDDSWHSSHQG